MTGRVLNLESLANLNSAASTTGCKDLICNKVVDLTVWSCRSAKISKLKQTASGF